MTRCAAHLPRVGLAMSSRPEVREPIASAVVGGECRSTGAVGASTLGGEANVRRVLKTVSTRHRAPRTFQARAGSTAADAPVMVSSLPTASLARRSRGAAASMAKCAASCSIIDWSTPGRLEMSERHQSLRMRVHRRVDDSRATLREALQRYESERSKASRSAT